VDWLRFRPTALRALGVTTALTPLPFLVAAFVHLYGNPAERS
jgi:hypothetical protein